VRGEVGVGWVCVNNETMKKYSYTAVFVQYSMVMRIFYSSNNRPVVKTLEFIIIRPLCFNICPLLKCAKEGGQLFQY